MKKEQIIASIKKMSQLLKNEMLSTGVYGKKHRNHQINECRKSVSRLVNNSAEGIFELIINDKNIYKENSKHDQIKILNDFVNMNQPHLDLETYKKLKNAIGYYVNNRK